MVFDWINAKEASLAGIKLADNLSAEMEKINLKNKSSKEKMSSQTKAIQKMFSQFDQFKQKNNLNFYKKSKLINEFRWGLLESSLDKEFIELVTRELTLYINKK